MPIGDLPFAPRTPPPPIALDLVTGARGAGKTTLLNRLLAQGALTDTAILLNEQGEVELASPVATAIESGVVSLGGGCLCCTVRGELVDALEGLLRDIDNGRAAYTRVVIEAAGEANPAPILHAIMLHPYLRLRYRLDAIIAVVAANDDEAVPALRLAQRAIADRIVLTKTGDGAAALDAARARLQSLNPAADILDLAEASAERLFGAGLYDPTAGGANIGRWLAEHRVAAIAGRDAADVPAVHWLQLETDAPMPFVALDTFLELLRAVHGNSLLRVKGVVRTAEQPEQPYVVHGIGSVFTTPTQLPAWPDADQRSRFLVGLRGDPEPVRKLFAAVTNAPAIDRPDRQAQIDNPLVPFGGIDR